MTEEKQAISRLINGDINALEVLVRTYYFQAVRAAYLILGDKSQAEDIVQAEFLALNENIHKYDPNRPFKPWFMRCVVNATLNKRRKNNRLVTFDGSLESEALNGVHNYVSRHSDPEAAAEAGELRELVWQAVQQLPPRQRASIVMRYYLDLNQAEMVARMDAPASSVKWWLYSGRQRLRELLAPDQASVNAQVGDLEISTQINRTDEEKSHG